MVEAICRLIVGNENATLGQALDLIKTQGKVELPRALREAFDRLYGYTSGTDGIRYALLMGFVFVIDSIVFCIAG